MLRFRIYGWNGVAEDSIDLEAETVEEIRGMAKRETEKRGWTDCWSKDFTHDRP